MTTRTCHMSDQELVAALPFSEAAFTEIYNRYWDRLLYLSATKLRSTSLAEEIVQDIFLDIWKRRGDFVINSTLERYLSVAVKYRIINAHAKMKREQDYRETRHEQSVQGEQLLDERELQKHLQKLISDLPEKCRITYRLSREEGLSLREVAYVMSVSQKAVEANLTRSLKLLRFGLRRILFSIFSIVGTEITHFF